MVYAVRGVRATPKDPGVGRSCTTTTGFAECWTTAFETLSSSAERNPERPREPTTTLTTAGSSAARRIASATPGSARIASGRALRSAALARSAPACAVPSAAALAAESSSVVAFSITASGRAARPARATARTYVHGRASRITIRSGRSSNSTEPGAAPGSAMTAASTRPPGYRPSARSRARAPAGYAAASKSPRPRAPVSTSTRRTLRERPLGRSTVATVPGTAPMSARPMGEAAEITSGPIG